MQLIALLVCIYLIYRYSSQIKLRLFGYMKSDPKVIYNSLSFSLSAVLEALSDRERILFRDSVDSFYRALVKTRGSHQKIDVRNITTLSHRADGLISVSPEAWLAITKTLSTIEDTAKKAPGNLESQLTLDQIYIFLKDHI